MAFRGLDSKIILVLRPCSDSELGSMASALGAVAEGAMLVVPGMVSAWTEICEMKKIKHIQN